MTMNRSIDQDYGDFNDSMVILNPIKFTNQANLKLAHHNQPQNTHLGIYNDFKLSQYIKSKQGKVLNLVTLDPNSMNTFINDEAISYLQQYPTNQIAFVFVIGNKKSGKSFFCDKILNLSQIKGNHFCRYNNIGINMWSTPFQKDTLKIFILQISGCNINSQQFKILSTYSIVVGSVFFMVDNIKQSNQTAISQFDHVITQLSAKLSQIQQNNNKPISQLSLSQPFKYMPQYMYYLKRTDVKRQLNLETIKYFIEHIIPDAKVASYKGTSQQIVHLSFLDTKSIDQNYVKSISKIFKQMYQVLTQKKFNQLILNGGIIIKILKYIQNYLNHNKNIDINNLYNSLIEQLYQSAYNFCILTYHQDMQKALQNQQPKGLQELLQIFEVNSADILQKFQEFNLDPKMHSLYYQKLQKHIDDKQKLIMQVNQLKTERVIMQSYDPNKLNNAQTYKTKLKYIKESLGHLTHGRAEALSKFNFQFYKRVQNVDYKSLQKIQNLTNQIQKQKKQYNALHQINLSRNKDKLAVQQLLKNQQALQKKKKQLQTFIQQQKYRQNQSMDDKKQDIVKYQQTIKKNNNIIKDLSNKDGNNDKKKQMSQIQLKIEQTKKNADRLQTLLNQLKSSQPAAQGNNGKLSQPKKQANNLKQTKSQPKKQQPAQKSKQK